MIHEFLIVGSILPKWYLVIADTKNISIVKQYDKHNYLSLIKVILSLAFTSHLEFWQMHVGVRMFVLI